MEAVSPLIPTHANMYWFAESGGKDNKTTREFRIWETYLVKRLAFVQPLSSANIQKLSYVGELVDDKFRCKKLNIGGCYSAINFYITYLM